MKIFKKISERLDRIESEIKIIRSEISSINASLELQFLINDKDALPKDNKKGRKKMQYPQIGTLLHRSGVTLKEWREEAERNGWPSPEYIKYDTCVGRDDAMVIIKKAKIRKRRNANPEPPDIVHRPPTLIP